MSHFSAVAVLVLGGLVAALVGYLVNQIPPIKKAQSGAPRVVTVIVVLIVFLVVAAAVLTNVGQGSRDSPSPPASPASSPPADQLTEFERLSEKDLSGPVRPMLDTPPRRGDFNCLSSDSFLRPESDFVWVKDIDTHGDHPWRSSDISVQPGHVYTLAIYPINCGLAGNDYRQDWLESASVRIDVPGRAGRSLRIGAVLRSASTSVVWDGVRFVANDSFTIRPVPGSVQYMSPTITQDENRRLGDEVFTTPQLIGDQDLDGLVRPCAKAHDLSSADCHILIYAQVQVAAA